VTRRSLFLLLLGIWALLWLGSIVYPPTMVRTGDGFTRGMNRVGAFFGLQIAAFVAALCVFAARPTAGRLRPLAWVPLVLAICLVFGLAALILWAQLRDRPVQDPMPVTSPASPALPVPTE
jgi:hypothetical protein